MVDANATNGSFENFSKTKKEVYMFDTYSTDNLTKQQYAMVIGIQAVIDDIEEDICDYCIGSEDEDTTVIDKLRCEIACDVLTELKDKVEGHMFDLLVSMTDENAIKVMSMSRKKAEKKFGKSFVSEVLDE